MKYFPSLAVIGICSLSTPVYADLFFSEYIEGSSFNKALELYNDTGETVDLTNYQIKIYFNGNSNPGTTINLSGSINNGEVYIVADDGADADILAVADLTSNANFFNGDDAIELVKNGDVIDAIGQVGFDPGSQWGIGDISTQNNTLRRKVEINSGDPLSSDAFDPVDEWEGYANNNFAGLGARFGTPEPEPVMYARIHEIQGEGLATSMQNQMVTVEAIVVGDFQNNEHPDQGDLRGFYLQEEDSDADSNPLTSEGIFVYDNNGVLDVSVGDKVTVTGRITEYNGLTEISADEVSIVSQAWPLPAATELTLPVSSNTVFEAYEGMRVRFPQSLVISEYYNFDRFGEIVLTQPLMNEQRPMTPTAIHQPGSDDYQARLDMNELSRITLDDGRTSQNPSPAMHPNGELFSLDNRFRGGDFIQNAEGVMDDRFGLYRIQPTSAANYIVKNERPELPPEVGEGIKVASFNVLNYFTTLDEAGNLCGPDTSLDCRGADNYEEFMRQRDKIIHAIATLDADIVGLIEIENNISEAMDDLVNGLNDKLGDTVYDKVDTGFLGADAIKVGFIYKPATVKALGDFAILDSTVDSQFIDEKNRPALAQTFMSLANAGRVTIVVNHFKSKGSPCDDLGDIDQNDGQGNCNLTRTAASQSLAHWLNSDPTGQGDNDYLIIGDLNAYDKEDPVRLLKENGYTDLILRDEGELAYTYVFNGQFGYLDYALANDSLSHQVSAARVWHINADEPDILDYDTSFKKDAEDALYETNAFRSSDHDPVLVGLDLQASISDIQHFIASAIETGELQVKGRHPERTLKHFNKLFEIALRLENYGRDQAACMLVKTASRFAGGGRYYRGILEGNAVNTLINILNAYRAENCRH
jgi:predicted extracellular nuclease